eukprot:gene7454-17065_t
MGHHPGAVTVIVAHMLYGNVIVAHMLGGRALVTGGW